MLEWSRVSGAAVDGQMRYAVVHKLGPMLRGMHRGAGIGMYRLSGISPIETAYTTVDVCPGPSLQ